MNRFIARPCFRASLAELPDGHAALPGLGLRRYLPCGRIPAYVMVNGANPPIATA
jgi:hypothetical protein